MGLPPARFVVAAFLTGLALVAASAPAAADHPNPVAEDPTAEVAGYAERLGLDASDPRLAAVAACMRVAATEPARSACVPAELVAMLDDADARRHDTTTETDGARGAQPESATPTAPADAKIPKKKVHWSRAKVSGSGERDVAPQDPCADPETWHPHTCGLAVPNMPSIVCATHQVSDPATGKCAAVVNPKKTASTALCPPGTRYGVHGQDGKEYCFDEKTTKAPKPLYYTKGWCEPFHWFDDVEDKCWNVATGAEGKEVPPPPPSEDELAAQKAAAEAAQQEAKEFAATLPKCGKESPGGTKVPCGALAKAKKAAKIKASLA